jgi:hypothetical protein
MPGGKNHTNSPGEASIFLTQNSKANVEPMNPCQESQTNILQKALSK